MAKPARSLTARQAAFVAAYLGPACFNATEAARQVGYASRSANREGSRLLDHPGVSAAVRAALRAQMAIAEEALARITGHARASLRDVLSVDTDGELVIDWRRAFETGGIDHIRRIRKTSSGWEIEMYDSLSADELLLRVAGRLASGAAGGRDDSIRPPEQGDSLPARRSPPVVIVQVVRDEGAVVETL